MERITHADIEEMRNSGYDRSTIADAQARLAMCERADELIAQIYTNMVNPAARDLAGRFNALTYAAMVR